MCLIDEIRARGRETKDGRQGRRVLPGHWRHGDSEPPLGVVLGIAVDNGIQRHDLTRLAHVTHPALHAAAWGHHRHQPLVREVFVWGGVCNQGRALGFVEVGRRDDGLELGTPHRVSWLTRHDCVRREQVSRVGTHGFKRAADLIDSRCSRTARMPGVVHQPTIREVRGRIHTVARNIRVKRRENQLAAEDVQLVEPHSRPHRFIAADWKRFTAHLVDWEPTAALGRRPVHHLAVGPAREGARGSVTHGRIRSRAIEVPHGSLHLPTRWVDVGRAVDNSHRLGEVAWICAHVKPVATDWVQRTCVAAQCPGAESQLSVGDLSGLGREYLGAYNAVF